MKQVASQRGAEKGRHVVNGHARPEFRRALRKERGAQMRFGWCA